MRKRMAELMKKHRFTCSSLAKEVGVDRSTISHIKSGRGINVEVALVIAKVLNASVEEIFLPSNALKSSKSDKIKLKV